MNQNNQYVVFEWEGDDRVVLASFNSLNEAQEFSRNHPGSDVEDNDPELFSN